MSHNVPCSLRTSSCPALDFGSTSKVNFLPHAAELDWLPALPDGTPETSLLIVFPTIIQSRAISPKVLFTFRQTSLSLLKAFRTVYVVPPFTFRGHRTSAPGSSDICSHLRCQLRFFGAKSVLQHTNKCPGNGLTAVLDLTGQRL